MHIRVLALACGMLAIGTAAAQADVPGVATTNTRLHRRPGARAPIIRRLPLGARLNVLSCVNRWCVAEWRGVQGYISQNLMDFPNGIASADQGRRDVEATTPLVRRRYVEPAYVIPDDDYPDYSAGNTYGPYYSGGLFIDPGYDGGRYHHWRGRRHWYHGGWDHWGNGAPRPVPPGWGQHAGGPRSFIRAQNPNPVVGNRPLYHVPGPGNHFNGPRPGGPGPAATHAPAPILRR